MQELKRSSPFIADRPFENSKNAFHRFPFGIIYTILLPISIFIASPMINIGDTKARNFYIFIAVSVYLLLFNISLGVSLIFEGFKVPRKYEVLGQINVIFILIGLTVVSSIFHNSRAGLLLYTMSLRVIALSLIFIGLFLADLFKKTFDNKLYSIYIANLLSNIILGITIIVVSFVTGYFIDSMVSTIYHIIGTKGSYFVNLMVFMPIFILLCISLFFGAFYFLKNMPNKDDDIMQKESKSIQRFIKNIITIFLVYIVALVFMIINLVNIKDTEYIIIINMLIFITSGYLTYSLSRAYIKENTYIKGFYYIYPLIGLALSGMIGFILWDRITRYSMTINRYLVLIYIIWLVLLSLYLLISRKKHLIYGPILLIFITIAASIGPWSIYEYPNIDQTRALRSELEQIGAIDNGSINTLYTEIDEELSISIKSRIDYLCKFDECRSIKEIFPVDFKDFEGSSINNIRSELYSRIGL